jgi:hydroxymethylbilane synthase
LHNKKSYKIGTRGSLLALTQCNQVKDQLEKLTGDHFELEIIKTQGDLITNAPLWQLDGKDFFTKELDEALISGKVDLVVHSYKDLGSERPNPIMLAAVTKRTYAHDILLIKNSTIGKLQNKKEFIVGTSSPRRMVNLEKNLKDYIPGSNDLIVSTKVLRGNVNTRISKLVNDEFDAIVIALPGIERLALTESSKKELENLLNGMNFLILPQSIFPSSASQGALGIECLKERTDNGELLSKLKLMEDENTKEEVKRERKAFNEYGGGCHLAVGINVKKVGPYFLHTHAGKLESREIKLSFLEGRDNFNSKRKFKVFVGMPHLDDKLISKKIVNKEISQSQNYFVSCKYAIESLKPQVEYSSLWASGTKTMRELCKRGYWVNGSSDSLGMNEATHLKNSRAISLMLKSKESLINLTSYDAADSFKTYERVVHELTEEERDRYLSYDLFYWSSYPQFQIYIEQIPEIKNKLHACGLGKTWEEFKNNNIDVIPFAGISELKNELELQF